MDEFLKIMAVAAVPALVGNLGGGLLGEVLNVSQRTISLMLHLAAGVILGVVAVEIMPEVLDVGSPWVTILAFVGGGLFSMLLDRSIGFVQKRFSREGAGEAGSWVLFFGVAMDSLSDGFMLGTGSIVALGLAMLIALAQTTADVPEGFVSIVAFKEKGTTRATRILLAAGLALPVFVGATVGYFALRGAPEILQMSILSFTAGILTTLAVEELVPRAHQGEDARLATMFLVGGFALFAFLSTYT